MSRAWKIGLASLCAVAVGSALIWTIWNGRATRRLTDAIRDLRTAGLPTALAELAPAPLPPERNGAVLYQAAFEKFRQLPDLQPSAQTAEPLAVSEELRKLLPSQSEPLDLLRQAADLPDCQFPLRYEDGFAMQVVHLVPLRRAADMLAARVVVRAEAGELDGAVDDLRVVFQMARALGHEQIMVSQLVRMAISEAGLLVLQSVLPRLPDPVAALRRVGPDPARGALSMALRGEVPLCLTVLDRKVLEAVLNDPAVNLPWIFKAPGAGPLLKSELADQLELYRKASQALRSPYPEAIVRLRELERGVRDQGDALACLVYPALARSAEREARLASSVELAQLAARFLAQRRKNGAFPSSLEALEGGPAPADPLTAAPFEVLEEAQTLVLRSRGAAEVAWRLAKR
jgi:hypothetical protein